MDINQKVAVVTGAGTSIGRELAREFARHGARVVCTGRRKELLQETAALIESEGGTAIAIPTDVTDPDQVQKMVQAALDRFGQIDLLFNNAGRLKAIGATWELDPEEWWQDVKVNLLGTMICCRAVLPHMIQRDSGIIFTMDGGGGTPGPNIGGSAYGCSKAALLRFTESLAGELERTGSSVLVFCMNPGFVLTEMTEDAMATPERRRWLSHIPELVGSSHEVRPDACAKAAIKLLRIACPELNGRAFHQNVDFALLERNLKKIRKQDLFVLKYARLGGDTHGRE